MSTSAIDTRHRRFLRHSLIDLSIAAFFVLFGAVYEHFSFGVYSNSMIYAFVPPMLTGIFLLFTGTREKVPEGHFILPLEMSAITLAVGSATKGAIEIYGTDNRLLKWYWVAGGILFAIAVVVYVFEMVHRKYK